MNIDYKYLIISKIIDIYVDLKTYIKSFFDTNEPIIDTRQLIEKDSATDYFVINNYIIYTKNKTLDLSSYNYDAEQGDFNIIINDKSPEERALIKQLIAPFIGPECDFFGGVYIITDLNIIKNYYNNQHDDLLGDRIIITNDNYEEFIIKDKINIQHLFKDFEIIDSDLFE